MLSPVLIIDQWRIRRLIITDARQPPSAGEAAEAIGCALAQIAQSIVFVGDRTAAGVMVIASGINRIDRALIAFHLGEPVQMATPAQARELTGFAIGGVPPCGHVTEIMIFIDEDLLALDELWAAAGTPNAVFKLAPDDLLELTRGRVVNIVGVPS